MFARRERRIVVVSLGLAMGLALVGLTGGGHMAASPPVERDTSAPLGTSFTFQGALSDTSGPVNDTCSFTFELHDDAAGGTPLGTVTMPDVEVEEGRFAVELDFGAGAFTGEARWLEIDVDCGEGVRTLSPRLKLTLAPYALYSQDSDKVDGKDANAFVSKDSAAVDANLIFSTGFQHWEMGCENPTWPPDPDTSYFYLKDLDDAGQPIRLLIWQDTGDVIIAKNLGVGTDSPESRLHVQGNSRLIGDWRGVYSEGSACGVEGVSDGVAVRGENSGTGNYAELGTSDRAIKAVSSSGVGAEIQASSGTAVDGRTSADNEWVPAIYGRNEGAGDGVYGWSQSRNGVFGVTSSTDASHAAVHGVNHGNGVGVKGVSSAGDGVRGESSKTGQSGVYGFNNHSAGFGVYGRNGHTGNVGYLGGAYGVYGESASSAAYAAAFKGNVAVLDRANGVLIVELGEGLDYAEGFDVSGEQEIVPGTVLVIDPDHPGELTVSSQPYDHKVAGIVAGAEGLGSGVRLGADRYDYDVALAGRVYCYVDALEVAVEPGDLLTTSSRPGYAMKVIDHARAQGAILGKAMEGLEKGQRGLILVLVTLQ